MYTLSLPHNSASFITLHIFTMTEVNISELQALFLLLPWEPFPLVAGLSTREQVQGFVRKLAEGGQDVGDFRWKFQHIIDSQFT